MGSICTEFGLPKINYLGFCASLKRRLCWWVREDHQRVRKRVLRGDISDHQEPGARRRLGIGQGKGGMAVEDAAGVKTADHSKQ
jgi:hypothetical protein